MGSPFLLRWPKRTGVRKPIGATLLATALAAGLTGCAPDGQPNFTPEWLRDGARPPVAIGVDPSSPEQVVIGEIYSQIFNSMGYAVGVTSLSSRSKVNAVEVLRTQRVDLVVTCTGTLLESQNRAAADALKESGEQGEALSVATYDAVVGTLPSSIRTVDPSPAQGCAPAAEAPAAEAPEGEPALPQNIIPVFTDGMFDRGTVTRLNFITRVMATEDIQKAAKKVEEGAPAGEAVADWLLEYAGIAVNGPDPVVADPSGEMQPS